MGTHKRLGNLGAAGAVASVALIVAGCGSSGTSSSALGSTAHIGGAAISRAADVSGAAQGEKVAYTISETLPSVGKLTVTGTGAYNTSPAQGEMDYSLSIPGISNLGPSAASLSNLNVQTVTANKIVYIKVPSSLASKAIKYTGGKPWVSINLAKVASASKVPGLSTLLNGQTSQTSPATELKELEAASSHGVTKVGTATVNGVATTEYSATLDLSKLSNELPAAQRAVYKQILAKAATQTGLTAIPYTVYIDSANLIRRVVLDYSVTTNGTKVPITVSFDYLAYGPQPAPTVPAASETHDLSGLLSSYADSSSGPSTLGG